ncbi:alpha/beta fold hydrolase [Mycobacterium branderi]|uniref:Epoxide hydrolase n=1 Tax=Mycobacterium branderi TaxID=43348 RepID=A0A7I7W4M6_9MYCO|nr:alpha/beta hydrolase [Mycobacterium branderi]MCV7233790.1 alpha/beta hydrolase [Mycobacterium branderi]ORA39668.1 epoxide hydrolase [Mycobacterium branderi]BBZ11755.1 epoxide hydrolase A [Mycobacterium branderi]
MPDTVPSTERIIETNGVKLHTVEAGERGAPVVVLAHGFPELAYSWRHQIPVLAAAGYHVLAPDQRGYGRSSRPDEISAYNIADLSADLIGLLDDVGAERAVFVGHDWGAPVAWSSAQLHPDRVAAVVGLSVPAVPRAQVPPTQAFRKLFGDNFFYMLYFQEPGVADEELGADPAKTMRRMMSSLTGDRAAALRMVRPGPEGFVERLPEPDGLPSWISAEELDHYIAEFSRTGFTGGLNWYRNLDRNWEILANPAAPTISVPALFVAGADDPVLTFMRRERASEVVTGPYREVILEGAGHWLQQEQPERVNEVLLDFLTGLKLS